MDDDDVIMAAASGLTSLGDAPGNDADDGLTTGSDIPGGISLSDTSTSNTATHNTPAGLRSGDYLLRGDGFGGYSLGDASTGNTAGRNTPAGFHSGDHTMDGNNPSGYPSGDNTAQIKPSGVAFEGGYNGNANNGGDRSSGEKITGESRNDSFASNQHIQGGYTSSSLNDHNFSSTNSNSDNPSGSSSKKCKSTGGNSNSGNSGGASPSGSFVPNAVIAKAIKMVANQRMRSQSGSLSSGNTTDNRALNRLIELSSCEKLKNQIIENAKVIWGPRKFLDFRVVTLRTSPDTSRNGNAFKPLTEGTNPDDLVDAERLPHQAKLLGYKDFDLRSWVWLKSGQATPSLYDTLSMLDFVVQRQMNDIFTKFGGKGEGYCGTPITPVHVQDIQVSPGRAIDPGAFRVPGVHPTAAGINRLLRGGARDGSKGSSGSGSGRSTGESSSRGGSRAGVMGPPLKPTKLRTLVSSVPNFIGGLIDSATPTGDGDGDGDTDAYSPMQLLPLNDGAHGYAQIRPMPPSGSTTAQIPNTNAPPHRFESRHDTHDPHGLPPDRDGVTYRFTDPAPKDTRYEPHTQLGQPEVTGASHCGVTSQSQYRVSESPYGFEPGHAPSIHGATSQSQSSVDGPPYGFGAPARRPPSGLGAELFCNDDEPPYSQRFSYPPLSQPIARETSYSNVPPFMQPDYVPTFSKFGSSGFPQRNPPFHLQPRSSGPSYDNMESYSQIASGGRSNADILSYSQPNYGGASYAGVGHSQFQGNHQNERPDNNDHSMDLG